jgi:hypothetical protein
MGLTVLNGRGFGEEDGEGALPVGILNEAAKEMMFQADEALGESVTLFETRASVPNVSRHVVGVVADVRQFSLAQDPAPAIYVPFAQEMDPGRRWAMSLAVRSERDPILLANGVLLAGYVEVGARVFISGNSVIHQFCKVGRLAMVGGMSAISKDIPPFCTTLPSSRNTVVGLNVIGLRRSGMTPAERSTVKQAFKLLYRSGLNATDAIEKIRNTLEGPALEFCEFADRSERGLCGGGVADEG